MNKLNSLMSFCAGIAVGVLLAWWLLHEQTVEVVEIDRVAARAELTLANCELTPTDRAVEREQVLLRLRDSRYPNACTGDYCGIEGEGERPHACPQDTPLAVTGQPAEVPMDAVVEREKLREEVKGEVAAEHKAKEAAKDAVEAAGGDVEAQAPTSSE